MGWMAPSRHRRAKLVFWRGRPQSCRCEAIDPYTRHEWLLLLRRTALTCYS
jgi:hypothetical protein